ncbi:MAG: hypothetical protein QGG40_16500, partial [Myxococcota bacterium]|nr:hypothetical protein [Myxococcota bacterium]
GHILNALCPRWARRTSQCCVALALLGGFLWPGWVVWGVLLLVLRAWISLPVPVAPRLSLRARWVAVLAGFTFLATFMPSPVEVETLSFDEIHWLGEDSPASMPTN